MAVHRNGYRPWRCIRIAARAAVALLAALAIAGPVSAAEKHAILVVDGNSGRTLYESAADALRHPASLAKMMTLYLVFEQIEQGRLTYQTKIQVSANAAAAAPSKLGLDEGDEIAVLDAIKALITKSANDVAVAVAEHIAGSEAKFARVMTQKAAQLGMKATLFKNASGLPDDEQVTTARDMITLALRLQDDFPKHYPLFATRTFTYDNDTYRNHNTLLTNYEGTDGLKTGYTNASGFNLVASVRRGQKHVIGVVFGGASGAQRDRTMRTFLNIGLVKASHVKTRVPAAPLVATARNKPEPVLAAAVPKPQRVERPPVKPVAPAVVTEQPITPKAPQPIEVARVKTVPISPGTTAKPDDLKPASIETVIEQATTEPAAPPQWATASTGGIPRTLPIGTDRPGLFNDPLLMGRGALPSTLDEQATRLAGPEPTTSAQTPASWQTKTASVETKTASLGAGGGFQIQIGAYQSAAEAERQLTAVRERAPLLRTHTPIAPQFKQGDKVFYRARFAGFDAQAAANACTELKRLKVDCLVVKAD